MAHYNSLITCKAKPDLGLMRFLVKIHGRINRRAVTASDMVGDQVQQHAEATAWMRSTTV